MTNTPLLERIARIEGMHYHESVGRWFANPHGFGVCWDPLKSWSDCGPIYLRLLSEGWVMWQGKGNGNYGMSPDYPHFSEGKTGFVYDENPLVCIVKAAVAAHSGGSSPTTGEQQ